MLLAGSRTLKPCWVSGEETLVQITCLLPLGYLMCRSVCAKNMLMPRICSAACPWPGAANLNAAYLMILVRIASRGQWCNIYTSRRMCLVQCWSACFGPVPGLCLLVHLGKVLTKAFAEPEWQQTAHCPSLPTHQHS